MALLINTSPLMLLILKSTPPPLRVPLARSWPPTWRISSFSGNSKGTFDMKSISGEIYSDLDM
ncbi:MAG: hypothetical protein RIC80_08200, partial [Cyclobacteriaceae bacterium]